MKLAVIGGGSTYTPELVDGIARLSGDIKVTEMVLVDPDESRLAVVGPVSARIMKARGHPARLRWTTDLDDGLDGAAAVLLQLRVGYQAARQRDETWPLEYGCVGQETTGAGRAGQGAAHRARGPGHRRPRPPPLAARRVDHRLHQPGGHRHPRAAGRRPPGHRAVQLRDRVPAPLRQPARRGPGAGRPGPRRAEPPDLGAGGAGRRGRRAARAHRRATARRSPGTSGCPRASCGTWARSPRTTCATTTRTTPWWPSSKAGRRAPRRWPRSSGSCSSSTPTRPWTTSRSC